MGDGIGLGLTLSGHLTDRTAQLIQLINEV